MKYYLIAERYASGLNAAVADTAHLDEILEGLSAFAHLYEASLDLQHLMADPRMRVEERLECLEALLSAMEPDPLLHNFLVLVLKRNRMRWLPDIVQVFERMVDERLDRIQATVVTAVPVDEAKRARLRASLERFTGKTIRPSFEVDPEILGGVVARIGNRVVDGSVRARLTMLREALLREERLSQPAV